MRDRALRLAALFVAAPLGACASRPLATPRVAAAAARPAPPPPAPKPSPEDDLPTFADLAARAGTLAPGMREAVRREARLEGAEVRADAARADDRDACVRVLFAADVPVRARLEDGAGDVLAAAEGAATSGALAAHGPACVRRGDVVRAVFAVDAEGAREGAARVRFIAWRAP